MKKIFMFAAALACIAILSLQSCSSSSSSSKATNDGDEVYSTMGGDTIVAALVSKSLDYASNDSRTSKFITASTKPLVKTVLTSEICNAIGGPCEHSAITLKEALKDTGFNAVSGNALLENIAKSFDDMKVTSDAKDDAIGSLAKSLLTGF